MVVLREGLEKLNLAPAMAMLMLAASVLVTLALSLLIGRAVPWLTGRARGEPWVWPHAMVGLLEVVGPRLSRLLLTLTLFPLALVAVASVIDSPQASVAQFMGFTWRCAWRRG